MKKVTFCLPSLNPSVPSVPLLKTLWNPFFGSIHILESHSTPFSFGNPWQNVLYPHSCNICSPQGMGTDFGCCVDLPRTYSKTSSSSLRDPALHSPFWPSSGQYWTHVLPGLPICWRTPLPSFLFLCSLNITFVISRLFVSRRTAHLSYLLPWGPFDGGNIEGIKLEKS